MKPTSPVVPGLEQQEIVIAKDQPPYQPLPALPIKDGIVTRWRLTRRERWRLLWSGDLFLWVLTFGKPLQPVLLTVEQPEVEHNVPHAPEVRRPYVRMKEKKDYTRCRYE